MRFGLRSALICASLVVALNANDAAHWGYSGEGSPEKWGELSPNFSACKNGKMQSPVDISNVTKKSAPAVKINYNGDATSVINNGHSIQVNFAPSSTLTLDGKDYELIQLHFHEPSEHTIDGKSFPMEAHFVHQAKDGQNLVFSVLFNKGAENKSIAEIWRVMPKKVGEKADLSKVDLSIIAKELTSYIRLEGSLTTPPCTEGIVWIINPAPLQASSAQIEAFTKIIGVNNRPIQPINSRTITTTK